MKNHSPLVINSILIIVTLIFSACFNLNDSNTGTITIHTGGGTGRSAIPWPPNDPDNNILNDIFFEITLTGNGQPIQLTANGGEAISATVSTGRWDVQVKAFYPDKDNLYAEGIVGVDVKAGRNNAVMVPMRQVLFTVTIDADNGTKVTFQTVAEGGKATKPDSDPEKGNFIFVHWFNTANNTKWDFDNDTVTENITLKAFWGNIKINQEIDWPGTYVLSKDGIFVLESEIALGDIANVQEAHLSELILVGGGGGGNGGDRDQNPGNIPHAYTFNGVTYTWPGKGGSSYILVNGNNLYEAEGGNPGGRGGNAAQPGTGGIGYRNGIGRHGGNGWSAPEGAGGAEYQTTGTYPDLYKAIHPGNGGSAAGDPRTELGFTGLARGGSGYGGGGAGAEFSSRFGNNFSEGYAGMGWGNSPCSQPLAGGTRDSGAGGGGGSGYFTENSNIAINGITTFRIIVGAGGNGAGHGALANFYGNGAAGGGSGFARIVGEIVVVP